MAFFRARMSVSLSLAFLFVQTGICQETSGARIAILPFVIDHLSPEETVRLRQDFAMAIGEKGRFNIQPLTATKSILEEAGLKQVEDCTTPPCVAELGKILGVDEVVSVTGSRLADNLTFQVQLVEASNASILYDHKAEYQGAPDSLLSAVITEQGRRLAGADLRTGTRWYVVVAEVVVSVAILYGIYTLLAPTSSSQSQGTGTVPSPQ